MGCEAVCLFHAGEFLAFLIVYVRGGPKTLSACVFQIVSAASPLTRINLNGYLLLLYMQYLI